MERISLFHPNVFVFPYLDSSEKRNDVFRLQYMSQNSFDDPKKDLMNSIRTFPSEQLKSVRLVKGNCHHVPFLKKFDQNPYFDGKWCPSFCFSVCFLNIQDEAVKVIFVFYLECCALDSQWVIFQWMFFVRMSSLWLASVILCVPMNFFIFLYPCLHVFFLPIIFTFSQFIAMHVYWHSHWLTMCELLLYKRLSSNEFDNPLAFVVFEAWFWQEMHLEIYCWLGFYFSG
jgi:hypothetical protein